MPRPAQNRSAAADNSKEFNQHFTACFGKRWLKLQPALLKEVQHVASQNAFVSRPACEDLGLLPWFAHGSCQCFRRPQSSGPSPPPALDPQSGLREYYWLDFASVLPALLVQAGPGMAVMDMCAAPGGKSLLLAQQIWAPAAAPAVSTARIAAAGQGQATSQPALEMARCDQQVGSEVGAASNEGASALVTGVQGLHVNATEEVQASAPAAPASAAAAPASATDAECQAEQGEADGSVCLSSGASSTAHSAPIIPAGAAKLVCNEPDHGRRARLQKVLEEYLPPPINALVQVTGHHADRYWGRNEAESYDRVLIDAPCSSDRHVLQQSSAWRGVIPRSDWSLKGCKTIAGLQLQLLLSGLRALKPGGRLVYSTCSLSPMENDEVVGRALKRLPPGSCQVVLPGATEYGPLGAMLQLFGAESTQHGVLCMPDLQGYGPIYVAVLHKVSSTVGHKEFKVELGAVTGQGWEGEDEESGDGEEGNDE